MQENLPELLVPVGDWSMLMAAIHNNADAVYIGVPGLNARGRSQDFSISELKEMIESAHLYGVKVHLAMNILIFQEEWPLVDQILRQIIPLGPDALIVQDLGLVRYIKALYPKQVIHASTQMTITNAQAIALVEDLNLSRFVLGRENNLEEIKKIKQESDKELEVFVHGALCVAYSGQCLTSESIGGRSANRGQCAQSCRLPYEISVDGQKKESLGQDFLFSPKDLSAINEVKALKEIGVDSFKIEGRLKSPEYVAASASQYAKAIKGLDFDQEQMALTYSRGASKGWLGGVDHQALVDGHYSSHRGLEIGQVLKVKDKKVWVKKKQDAHHLMAGDGLLFSNECGASLFAVEEEGDYLKLSFDRHFSLLQIKTGLKVYKNSSPKLNKELARSWSDRQLMKKIPLRLSLVAKLGQKLCLKATDEDGHEVILQSLDVVQKAQTSSTPKEEMVKELEKLGGSCFKARSIEFEMDSDIFIPLQWIKSLRKSMVEKMTYERVKVIDLLPSKALDVSIPFELKPCENEGPKLNILLRKAWQVKALVDYLKTCGQEEKEYLGAVILDFEFGRDYAPSLELLKASKITSAIASLRIMKPGELHHLKTLVRLDPDYFLVRNLGALEFFKQQAPHKALKGDFSLNITNALSAQYLQSKNLKKLCPSYDLNAKQLIDLLNSYGPQNFEIVIHQYMPEFHMEHCVFANYLSKGHSFRDCGKPCERHHLMVKDPYGVEHILKADQECRNTLFKAKAQSAASFCQKWQELGVKEFRLEFLEEDEAQIIKTFQSYSKLLAQKTTPQKMIEELGIVEKFGVTEGQLALKDDYRDRKKQ